MERQHHYQDLITIFNDCFFEKYHTLLVKGDDEPLYLPADENRPHHELFFAHGFFASALHESSHWLIAGENRRKLVDFGYWYLPDGRTNEQQKLFQSVEIKPQAMEWILSVAVGSRFRVSIDNLRGSEADTEVFKHAVHQQVRAYCEKGLPMRAEVFRLRQLPLTSDIPSRRFFANTLAFKGNPLKARSFVKRLEFSRIERFQDMKGLIRDGATHCAIPLQEAIDFQRSTVFFVVLKTYKSLDPLERRHLNIFSSLEKTFRHVPLNQ